MSSTLLKEAATPPRRRYGRFFFAPETPYWTSGKYQGIR